MSASDENVERTPDDGLLILALINKLARWEFFSGSMATGEIVCGHMRYVTDLDADHCPIITEPIRSALTRVVADYGLLRNRP